MEEKKLDVKSIIGFVLIFGILLLMMWNNQPSPEELAAEKAKQEQIDKEKATVETSSPEDVKVVQGEDFSNIQAGDSLQQVAAKNKLGAFAYAAGLASKNVTVNNGVLDLVFAKKGGHLSEVKLSEFVDFDSIPIYLVKENNASFNINFGTTDSRILNTKDLPFQSKVTKNGENTVVSMKLKVSETKFLEYLYVIKPNDYMIDFTIKSQGLSDVINGSQEIKLDWSQTSKRHDESITYENRYTRLTYQHDGSNIDKLGATGEDEEEVEDLEWLSFRQHFFSSILVANNAPLKSVMLTSKDLVEDEDIDTLYTKTFGAKTALAFSGNELNQSFGLFYGPTESNILSKYDKNLEESIPFGWGLFGWINKYLFIPLFTFLSSFLPYGIAIIVMTVLIKLLMSFVQYKQYLSQMKMKILKPELEAIKEKYKDNKMKAQQETMALQNKAGASPLAGCLPALIQMPVFYALFM
ncbi:membrane protein insertase YidC, partial [Lacinutrix sp.]|uniref:membrane protein insertase YidC n=1 Tax=Lacinutrix sp. TaxID=1937692 RepID=UPI0025C0DD90